MSFLDLNRSVRFLSEIIRGGLSDAPSDSINYGRIDGEWVDTYNIVPVSPSPAFDLNNPIWIGKTGNFEANDIPNFDFGSAPFLLEPTVFYSYTIQCFAGVTGSLQKLSVRSTSWDGIRFFIRGANNSEDIIDVEWTEFESFLRQVEVGFTSDPILTTILSHPIANDTNEQITFLVTGNRISGGFAVASFEIKATAVNTAGVTVLIGSTTIFQHKTVGSVMAQAEDDGSANCLLQVMGTTDDWEWKVEALFNRF